MVFLCRGVGTTGLLYHVRKRSSPLNISVFAPGMGAEQFFFLGGIGLCRSCISATTILDRGHCTNICTQMQVRCYLLCQRDSLAGLISYHGTISATPMTFAFGIAVCFHFRKRPGADSCNAAFPAFARRRPTVCFATYNNRSDSPSKNSFPTLPRAKRDAPPQGASAAVTTSRGNCCCTGKHHASSI